MRRRDFLKQLGWMTLAAGGAGTGVGLGCTAERRPNLILINVDDLGWTDLGCYGSPYYETPNIDRLCAQGIKFTDAYAAAAVCSPTRSALLTGRYPARTGVTDWLRPRTVRQETIPSPDGGPGRYVDDPDQALLCPARQEQLPPEEQTIAEVLREVGYSTAHIGKWHLGHGESLPEHQGFDSNKGGGRYGQTPTYWDPYELSRQKLHGLPSRKVGEYLTDREAAEAVAFINDHRDHPFFLNLWHYAVHTPLHAKEELIRKYENRISDEERKNRPTYAAMLESVDDAVGAVLAALDDLGLAERTLVMLTSDNGGQPAFTEMAPLRGGKGEPYEAGTRVPQIIRWKNRVRPSVSSVPVTSVDIFPTFCDIAGARASQVIDGTSLLPIMDGGRFDSERSLYWHYPHYWNGEPPYSIVRKGRWKLIRRYEPGSTAELYDLVADLGERRNLARVRKATRQLLRADLKAWLDETGALLPLTRPTA
jgi:arylsulfatase A